MALEAIKQIKEAEIQGDEIISKAKAKCKELVKSTSLEVKEDYEKVIELSQNKYTVIIKEAAKEAELKSIPILNDGREKINKITSISEERFNKAVNLVVERIVNKNGHS